MVDPAKTRASKWVISSLLKGSLHTKDGWVEELPAMVDEEDKKLWGGQKRIWWGSNSILGFLLTLSGLANQKTMHHPGRAQSHHDHTILCYYCMFLLSLFHDQLRTPFSWYNYSWFLFPWWLMTPFMTHYWSILIVCQTHSLWRHSLSLSSLF